MKKLILIPILLFSLMVFSQVEQHMIKGPYRFYFPVTADAGFVATPFTVTNTRLDTITTITATDLEGQLREIFAPLAPPVCAVTSETDVTLYEYQSAGGSLPVDVSYSVIKSVFPPSHTQIKVASITCNKDVGNFTSGSFHDGNNLHNQSGSQTGITLVVNSTNTFTVIGTSGDNKTCSSTLSYYFTDKRYWFSEGDGVITNAEIIAGSQDFNTGHSSSGVTYSFTSLNEKHVVIALPYSSDPQQAQIGAFKTDISSYFTEYNEDETDGFQLTNASGGVRNYRVLVSNQKYTATSLDVTLFN